MTEPPKVALVTGAGRGIGRAAALALAADGWSLSLAGRDRAALEVVGAEVIRLGPPGLAIVADVTDEASVRRLFAQTTSAFGRLDLLFNNAGTAAPSVPLEELSLADWSKVIATNITGAFLCTRAPLLKRRHPRAPPRLAGTFIP
jgi:NAD(P)-dependent dehydrogenase (short-subunit alcohol dehydrogenase family)